MALASFTPITLTAETISQLIREGYIDSMTLYVAYAEISSWQDTKNVLATTEFMKKRLKWGDTRFINAKKVLVNKKLISNNTTKGDDGRITGHFIFINYLVSTPHSNQGVDERGGGFQGGKCLITKTKVLNNIKEVHTDFQTFYKAYPRKTKRPDAERAFSKAIKKTSLDTMLKALEVQKPHWKDPKYIPHPSSWLNSERWADEIEKGSEKFNWWQ